MAIIEVTESSFAQEVLQSDRPVLVDFYADWCGPCRMLRPTLEAIAADRPDVKVASVNTEVEEELAEQFEISAIPCVILFKNGVVADTSVGLVPREALEAML